MKRISLTLVFMAIMCWGNLVLAASIIVTEHPGISLIQDEQGDLFLVKCDPSNLVNPCSLPPGVPVVTSPPWTDIQMAKAHQVGKKWVDFHIITYGDIPKAPLFGFFSFAFVFNWDYCKTGSNYGFRVMWKDGVWSANWWTITSCGYPREVKEGDPIFNFIIEGDTVKVRVSVDDLYTNVLPTDPLYWLVLAPI